VCARKAAGWLPAVWHGRFERPFEALRASQCAAITVVHTVSAANAKALLLSVQSSQECTLFWDVYVGRHVQQYMPTALLSKQDTSVLHIH